MNDYKIGYVALRCRAGRNRLKKRCNQCEARFVCWTLLNNDDVMYYRKQTCRRSPYFGKDTEIIWTLMYYGIINTS